MHQMRAVSLTGYLDVAGFVSLDGRRMLRRAGIDQDALADPENRLPARAVIELLERSAEESRCDSFGLLMAETRSLASLGPLSLLLERLPNVREVVRTASAFQRHLNDVVTIELEEIDGTSLVRLDLVPGYWGDQLFDLVVGVAYRVLTTVSGNRWRPAGVHVTRAAPADLAPWRRLYAAPIEFEAGFNGLSSSSEAMRVANPLADDVMARNARRLLQLVPLDTEPAPASDQVRRLIRLLLPSGRPTLARAAARLGYSERSLQRRLDDEGHSFGELLDQVRRELAPAYLAASARPVTAIAAMLGYSSPSSFTRWFTGEFGLPPREWRTCRTGYSGAVAGAASGKNGIATSNREPSSRANV